MQTLVIKSFSREIHRPSSDQEWQIPEAAGAPKAPFLLALEEPDEEHDTSYLADSAKILIFSCKSNSIPPIRTFVLLV